MLKQSVHEQTLKLRADIEREVLQDENLKKVDANPRTWKRLLFIRWLVTEKRLAHDDPYEEDNERLN